MERSIPLCRVFQRKNQCDGRQRHVEKLDRTQTEFEHALVKDLLRHQELNSAQAVVGARADAASAASGYSL